MPRESFIQVKRLEIGPVKEGVRLEVRSEAQVEAIRMNLLSLCDGNGAAAGLLFRQVTASFFGQTWGKSLMVSDREALLDIGLVIARAAHIVSMGEAAWRAALVAIATKEVVLRPSEISLIYAMVVDLTGEEGTSLFKEQMVEKIGLTVSPSILENGKKTYEMIAGLSYWEMDGRSLSKLILACFASYSKLMERVKMATDNNRDLLEKSLVDSRTRLREMAAVVLGRGMVEVGNFISGAGATLTYADLVSLLD